MKHFLISIAVITPAIACAQLADSSKRVVKMEGTVNFRDIGGYATKDGHSVKWGKIYRSADISKLTARDIQVMEGKNIHTVIDFRGVKEAEAAPDKLPAQTEYTLCPAGSDSLPDAKQMIAYLKDGSFLQKFYSSTQYFGPRYKPFFQKLLILPDNQSLIYHCTGGRDRTGMATALLLYILGVPQSTIEADFVASNVYLEPMNNRMFQGLAQSSGMDLNTIKSAFELKPELIQTMFSSITAKYGSVESFFQTELGIGQAEIQTLKKKFLL
ncbi:MAG: tyrosine-protein phosphatase [Chitinophagaceae bacterium]